MMGNGAVYGIDVGSRWVKIACCEGNERKFLGRYDTAEFYRLFVAPGPDGGVLKRELLGIPAEAKVVATGYGKARVGGNVRVLPELEAITEGVRALTGLEDALILDVGGQDSKMILMEGGRMVEFAANDRCAASSGRFLENMARVLGMSLEELGRYWKGNLQLSSTCAVFGETELIGLMAEGHPMEEIAAGVNRAIVLRLWPLVARFASDRRKELVLTGGVAYSLAIRTLIAERWGRSPVVPSPPDYVAAVGCCASGMVAGEAEG